MCVITATALTAAGVAAGIASTMAVVGNVALAVGAIGAVAGTALGVVGNISEGKAKQAQYNYQAQVDQQNAKIADQNAKMERQAGLEQARRKRIQTLQQIGSQTVGLAANGVDVATGSSLDIIEDTGTLGELDALMIETEAERRAVNYEIQGMNFQNESNMALLAGRNARKAGNINAWATGIKGVGDIGMKIGGSMLGSAGGLGSLGSSGAGGLTMPTDKLPSGNGLIQNTVSSYVGL